MAEFKTKYRAFKQYSNEKGTGIEIEEVEAIPIEWMIKKAGEYSKKYGDVFYAVIYGLYDDWRKEVDRKVDEK